MRWQKQRNKTGTKGRAKARVGDMHEVYKGFGLVSTKTAQLQLDAYGWLIDNFAGKHGLPDDTFYRFSEAEILTSTPPASEPERSRWIQDRFNGLKHYCNMAAWPISFQPQPEKLPPIFDKTKEKNTQQNRLTEIHGTRQDEKYYITEFGHPVIYYHPDMVDRPGYIKKRIVNRLSDMLHKTAPKPIFIQDIPNTHLTILCGTLMGFGHIFCAGQKLKKKRFSKESQENLAVFSLGIYFQLMGLKLSEVIEHYGQYLSKETIRGLKSAYRQLKCSQEQISVLRQKLMPECQEDAA